jgi:hypothetical protein
MNFIKLLVEGAKLAALFSAVALVVWSMPEYADQPSARDRQAALTLGQAQ